MNFVFCAPHFGAAREGEKLFWPPKPPVPLDAEGFEEATDDELRRWAKKCAQESKKYPDSGIRPDEFEPYRREKARRLSGPVFVARQAEPSHLRVAGERPADVLVRGISVRKRGRAGYRGERTLEDPKFRALLATFLDEDVVASWYAITRKERTSIRNRKRRLAGAEKGDPDQGRPEGARDEKQKQRASRRLSENVAVYEAIHQNLEGWKREEYEAAMKAQRVPIGRGMLSDVIRELLEGLREIEPIASVKATRPEDLKKIKNRMRGYRRWRDE